jgi:hypothetical protein
MAVVLGWKLRGARKSQEYSGLHLKLPSPMPPEGLKDGGGALCNDESARR